MIKGKAANMAADVLVGTDRKKTCRKASLVDQADIT